MAGDAGLGPWPTKDESEKNAEFYGAQMTSAGAELHLDEEAIDLELTNKGEPTLMENNTVESYEYEEINPESINEEETILLIDEGFEEEQESALARFWAAMNKPYYVRTWFGFPAPNSK